jgi:oligopeptide transport system substrate-binding protein
MDGQSLSLYRFRHILFQRYLYNSLDPVERAHLHQAVGTALEALSGEGEEEIAAVVPQLAWHFQEAGVAKKAINYLCQAGDRARGLYAHEEAIDYYQRALAFLKEQGNAGRERAARTLMKLGLTYHTAFDFQRAHQAYEEGFALWQRLGEIVPAIPQPAPHALRVSWLNPPTLDPTMAWDTTSAMVIGLLFNGLLELSPEMEVVPSVAQSWEVLEGGRKYIFQLRDDVQWSDGTPVTAGDFEYAWKRVLDPATESPSASKLFDVKRARAFQRGEMSDPNQVGVQAVDAVTLAVELEEPTGYFLHLLAHHISYPVPRHVVAVHGEVWAEPENIVTNGPFRLETWSQDKSMVLSRNTEYHGRFRGNLQRVELSLLSDWSARFEMYKADGLDIFELWRSRSPEEMDSARHQHTGDYITGPSLVTMYVGFDVSRPPFDDARVRRAFVHAVDRETLASVLMRGYVFPATGGFVPPGMPGHLAGIGLQYDPGQAQHLLVEAGYPKGGDRDFPRLELLTFHGGESRAEYLQAQWRENLGIEVTLQSMEFGMLLEKLDSESPPMFLIGWGADYPDPDDFLRVCPARRWTGWQNEAYTGLVEKAKRVTNQGERMHLYQKADQILVEAAAIMPLTYGRQHWLVKPWVKQFLTPAMYTSCFWKDVIIEAH